VKFTDLDLKPEILKALKKRDLEGAKKELKAHILFVHKSYIKRFEAGIGKKSKKEKSG